MEPELFFLPDLDKLNKVVITSLISLAHETVSETGKFSIALSGGRTPLSLYSIMGEDIVQQNFPYFNTHFFWGDERFVQKDHDESNFKWANEKLLSKINIPDKNIFPIYQDNMTIQECADAYNQKIETFFAENLANDIYEEPLFDAILLGLGKDGHTGSLFPGDKAVEETSKFVLPATAPSEYSIRERITFTLPLINRSRRVYFIVSGKEKQEIVETIINDPETAERKYPAALVTAKERLMWYLHDIKV